MGEDITIMLVSDGSNLSQEAQDFLEENNIEYNMHYQSHEKGEKPLPWIFDGMGNCYSGERGFRWYQGMKKSA